VLPTMHLAWGWGFLTSPRSIVPGGRAVPDPEEETRETGR
jgi:hypothetical protein